MKALKSKRIEGHPFEHIANPSTFDHGDDIVIKAPELFSQKSWEGGREKGEGEGMDFRR